MSKLCMLVGLPGSGKSTYAKNMEKKGYVIHSSDALRKELFGDEEFQEENEKIFEELKRRIKTDLKEGKNVVFDACNISRKRRVAFLNEVKKICEKECIILATPYYKCLELAEKRERKVPGYVIEKMYKNWNTPYWFEGWDNIKIEYLPGFVAIETPEKWAGYVRRYNQHNPWHKETLGEHLTRSSEYIKTRSQDDLLYVSSLIHDCGKPATCAFKNSKGEPSDIAHFYGHENTGAYDSLFFNYINYRNIEPLDISIRVNLHMLPHKWEKETKEQRIKLENKYRKTWGDKLFEDMLLLKEADDYARVPDKEYFDSLLKENEPELE